MLAIYVKVLKAIRELIQTIVHSKIGVRVVTADDGGVRVMNDMQSKELDNFRGVRRGYQKRSSRVICLTIS